MNIYPSVVLVDDEKNTREGLKTLLEIHGYEVDPVADGYRALEIIKRDNPDIVLTDMRMPEMDGMTLLEHVKRISPETLVIVMTAYGTVDNAVRAMQAGAFHYIMKPLNTDELLEVLKKAVSTKRLEQENKELKTHLKERYEFDKVVFVSQKMHDVIETIKQVAPTNASVLITGESGTGKELVARMIHSFSLRKSEAFVPVHCASLTETLLASELFGHERGAFTGAVQRNIGRFERAHKGTLFLDEIAEIKEEMQVKLLRVLQEGEFERVGGAKTMKADVRIISATNKNLQEEIAQKRFREDLFYRLNVVSIHVPPLRERREDVRALVHYYIEQYSKINHKHIERIDEDALGLLEEYHWPGNVRELKNVTERMIVLSKNNILRPENVPADIRKDASVSMPVAGDQPLSTAPVQNFKDMERILIVQALQDLKGNKSEVAKKLGISRRTLYRKLEDFNLA